MKRCHNVVLRVLHLAGLVEGTLIMRCVFLGLMVAVQYRGIMRKVAVSVPWLSLSAWNGVIMHG